MSMNPEHPVYVISKGRWESRLTVKALESCHVPYTLVIEPQEFAQYATVVSEKNIAVLPFSNLGQGSIPARNWVWDDSMQRGASHHWILDDNLRGFYRLNRNMKHQVRSGVLFRIIEDWVSRYTNVALAGMNYELLVARKKKVKPYVLNSRIYSCILIQNAIPYRWRGRYNEDTDLSLRALKDGWCTMLFNAFLCNKQATMRMKGGNTDELYAGDGRLEMAKSLQRQHPDVVRITHKWGRYQHQVDYRPFRNNRLKRRAGQEHAVGINEYGMQLVSIT